MDNSNETEKETRQQSVFSHEGSPEVSQGSLPGLVSSSIASGTLATTRAYYTPQPVSPIHEPVTLPRYICIPFKDSTCFLFSPKTLCALSYESILTRV